MLFSGGVVCLSLGGLGLTLLINCAIILPGLGPQMPPRFCCGAVVVLPWGATLDLCRIRASRLFNTFSFQPAAGIVSCWHALHSLECGFHINATELYFARALHPIVEPQSLRSRSEMRTSWLRILLMLNVLIRQSFVVLLGFQSPIPQSPHILARA